MQIYRLLSFSLAFAFAVLVPSIERVQGSFCGSSSKCRGTKTSTKKKALHINRSLFIKRGLKAFAQNSASKEDLSRLCAEFTTAFTLVRVPF